MESNQVSDVLNENNPNLLKVPKDGDEDVDQTSGNLEGTICFNKLVLHKH